MRKQAKSFRNGRLFRSQLWRTYCQLDMEKFRPDYDREKMQKYITYHLPMASSLLMTFLYTVSDGFLAGFILILWVLAMFQSLMHSLEMRVVYAESQPPTNRFLVDRPKQYGFKHHEIIELNTSKENVIITGFLLFHSENHEDLPTIYFLHGNAGNMGHRLQMCKIIMNALKCNFFIIDYRGYGLSTGFPSEAGLCEDAQIGFDFLSQRQDINPTKIFVFGRSLGGALAIDLVTKNKNEGKIAGFLLENTFTSLPEISCVIMSKVMGNLLSYVPNSFFYNIYPSSARLEDYSHTNRENKLPGLFIVGDSDSLIPPRMMKSMASSYFIYDDEVPNKGYQPIKFLNSLSSEKLTKGGLIIFPQGNHDNTWTQPHWLDVIVNFIQNVQTNQKERKIFDFMA